MPRLSFKEYLEHRTFLNLAWEGFEQLYSLLRVEQQWQLHDYYQPLHDFTDDELREHRDHITMTDPSLPARAGRHYAKLHRVYETGLRMAKQNGQKQRQSGSHRGPVTVRAVARPEPDLEALARVILQMAIRGVGVENAWPSKDAGDADD